ncbi:hypothetical protein M501DRAFT_992450 [Patellaria atrata CBS 101060]|uniref:Uncharacterized protein n=1 Tax=Patellaria atrata CBS 101060 TaxID=1346257 RepID=A0A9P4S9H0_9PEZI|nr:hypothetical protein M501DRAFT_992450 [Patellaria atrata CBS 101060]
MGVSLEKLRESVPILLEGSRKCLYSVLTSLRDSIPISEVHDTPSGEHEKPSEEHETPSEDRDTPSKEHDTPSEDREAVSQGESSSNNLLNAGTLSDQSLQSKRDAPPSEIIGPLLKKPRNSNYRTSKLDSLWTTASNDVTISKAVAEALLKRSRDLYGQPKTNHRISSPTDYYAYMCKFETGQQVDRLLWRYITCTYHDLLLYLDGNCQRRSHGSKSGITHIINVICASTEHSIASVKTNIDRWNKASRRWHGLISALGGSGCLVLLLDKLSDYMLSSHFLLDYGSIP